MTAASFVELRLAGGNVTIEYAWIEPAQGIGSEPSQASAERPRGRPQHAPPLLVFLHEGLGSLAMWRDYPQALCDAGGCRGLVYSRPGYGRSTPRRPDERWPVEFMHTQAVDVLPRLLDRLRIDRHRNKPWLFGHSDGGSIALIHAVAFPGSVAGVIAVAPHIFVEDVSVASIEKARDAYRTSDLRARLARYHDDPDSAFWGWNDIWLDTRFRTWSIEAMLAGLRCPILAVQGEDDEYGTLAQVQGIRRHAPQTEVAVLANCGHSPHRDQPAALTRLVTDYMTRHPVALTCQGGTP